MQITQSEVAKLHNKLKSLEAPTCSRCGGHQFRSSTILKKDITWCIGCGKKYILPT